MDSSVFVSLSTKQIGSGRPEVNPALRRAIAGRGGIGGQPLSVGAVETIREPKLVSRVIQSVRD